MDEHVDIGKKTIEWAGIDLNRWRLLRGELIDHQRFGLGSIQDVQPEDDSGVRLVVQFDDGSKRNLYSNILSNSSVIKSFTVPDAIRCSREFASAGKGLPKRSSRDIERARRQKVIMWAEALEQEQLKQRHKQMRATELKRRHELSNNSSLGSERMVRQGFNSQAANLGLEQQIEERDREHSTTENERRAPWKQDNSEDRLSSKAVPEVAVPSPMVRFKTFIRTSLKSLRRSKVESERENGPEKEKPAVYLELEQVTKSERLIQSAEKEQRRAEEQQRAVERRRAEEQQRAVERQRAEKQQRAVERQQNITKDLERLNVKEIYYIAPLSSLKSILLQGILSRNELIRLGINSVDFSLKGAQSYRAQKVTPDGQSIHNFVNLYFNPRNATLYRVIHESLKPQETCVLCIGIECLYSEQTFVSDENLASPAAKVFEAESGLSRIDPKILFSERWDHDPITKRKMCAEVLVPNKLPTTEIKGIRVSCTQAKKDVLAVIQQTQSNVQVIPDEKLFFNKKWRN